jgi:flagellar hook-associated protein 2
VTTGVDITLGASTPLATDITVTVERDGKVLTDKVKAMVDGINAALDEIKSLTAYDAATGKGGMLVGDSTLRKIRNDVLSTVTSGLNGASFAEVGIEVDRAGKLVFDEAKFAEAYAADPGAVSDQFTATGGFATKFESLAKQISDSYEGTLTTSIKSRSSNISRLNNDIENWDTRLALRRTALERQFSGLEVALSNLQNQGNWLAGQLAGLPKWSS